MQDTRLRELVEEVNRCNTNFNKADKFTLDIVAYQLRVAEDKLDEYLKEVKEGRKAN